MQIDTARRIALIRDHPCRKIGPGRSCSRNLSPGLLSRRVSGRVVARGLPLSDQPSAHRADRNPRRTFLAIGDAIVVPAKLRPALSVVHGAIKQRNQPGFAAAARYRRVESPTAGAVGVCPITAQRPGSLPPTGTQSDGAPLARTCWRLAEGRGGPGAARPRNCIRTRSPSCDTRPRGASMPLKIPADAYDFPCHGYLAPDNTALIVIDMQADFCAVGGLSTVSGTDLEMMREPIEP